MIEPRTIRQRGYLILLGLLLVGGGMTAGLSVILPPVEHESAESPPDGRDEPVAAAVPAPIIQTAPAQATSEAAQSTAEASQPAPAASPAPDRKIETAPAAAEPAQRIADAQPTAPAKPAQERQPERAPPQVDTSALSASPQAHASAPSAPPQLPPESLIAAEPPPPPEIALSPSGTRPDVASGPAPETPARLAALTPPNVPAPAEALPAQPASLGALAPRPGVPLPPQRPAELTSETTALAADLFSNIKSPSTGPARVVGFYSAGCIAGARQLALQGRYWQVMRPSRDRYWGHPELIGFIERLGQNIAAHTDWPGILIGDMAQPRGGPLPAGHASHQIGLDVDIWLRPMPKEPYTPAQTETVAMLSVVAADNKQLDKKVWQAEDAALIKSAAEQPEVERIFVNPAIKKELCRTKTAADESWISKVRPWYGHDEHVHVRLKCPPGSPACREQEAVPDGDGCGKPLEHWFRPGILAIQERLRTQAPVKRTMKMRALPSGCVAVLHAPDATNLVAISGQ